METGISFTHSEGVKTEVGFVSAKGSNPSFADRLEIWIQLRGSQTPGEDLPINHSEFLHRSEEFQILRSASH
jgi:hypothetical protein